MFKFISRLFDENKKELKRLQLVVEKINSLEPDIKKLSDKKLAEKTVEFKKKIGKGVDLKEILPEVFAVIREASVRVINERHYDVQLMAAICLFEGKIAEQKTGEGKTLSATPALYLRALVGKGAHLVTVNDYLARIGCGWMGPIFHFLGLTVGCIIPHQSFVYDPDYKVPAEDKRLIHLKPVERKEAYTADITYATNNELGFDYLRDNMAQNSDETVQRKHYFAIVDEIDFGLIDEARTPLIISSPADEATDKYYRFASLAGELFAETDYVIDEKAKTAMLTEYGIRKVERKLGVGNLYEEDFDSIHHIENALKAVTLFQKDKDYIVKDGQVIIVDEFTGRLMHGRRWSDGLHQAIEAKEGVKIERESKTWATVTFQNYFRLYEVLSGMTGTAATEAEEFKKIYDLDVIVMPTNRPIQRIDHGDMIYKTQRAKYAAVIAEIEDCFKRGQPVLVGTTSIERNEMIGQYLKKNKIPHEILNAKHHEKEAGIISRAGKFGAVTIATNMAGRGVDIILGGQNPTKEEHDKVVKLGGLHVIGTERHEARRIDNQLRGRSGRQGDPGSSRFYISLEDDLMRIFGGEQIASMMTRFKMPEDMPISHSMVSKMIEQIQVKVEGFNYDVRKSLVEFDDIVNKQREIIYRLRREILESYREDQEKLKQTIFGKLKKEIEIIVDFAVDPETTKLSEEKIVLGFAEIIAVDEGEERKKLAKEIAKLNKEKVIDYLVDKLEKLYKERETALGKEIASDVGKSVLLYTIDTLWVDHLTALDSLKEGVRLRGYGQRDPLVEYRKESYEMFQQLLAKIDYHFARRIFRVEIGYQPRQQAERIIEKKDNAVLPQGDQENVAVPEAKPVVSAGPRPGRNDPCPCGSGKKYKKCHINSVPQNSEEQRMFDLYFSDYKEWERQAKIKQGK